MLHGLRGRMILGFGLVIVMSLAMSGVGAVLLLRDQQADAAEGRIGRLIDPLTQWVSQQEFMGASPEYIAGELTAYALYEDVRILLLDTSDTVVFDTDTRHSLVGTAVAGLGSGITATGPGHNAYRQVRFRADREDLYLFATSQRATVPVGWPSPVSPVSPVIAVPTGDVTEAWSALLPRLLLAGGLAAVAGVAFAWVLADRITRPVHQMKLASERMAHGHYDQLVEIGGTDEVADLGRSFNRMVEQVNRSSRSMRELLANVSHELKTPLTSIQGFSQAIVEGVARDPEEMRQLAGVVHEESERMQALVEDLLYLSRLESGELLLEFAEIDLDAATRAAVRRLQFVAKEQGIRFVTDLDGGVVRADERRVEQVLANLLDNAARYAPAGTEIAVTSRVESDAVTVAVHNSGPPIPLADQPLIFDRFYQVDRARSRDRTSGNGHSGLGLAIVQQLMHAHGGSVGLVSTAEAGTSFTVRFPLPQRAAPVAPPARRWSRTSGGIGRVVPEVGAPQAPEDAAAAAAESEGPDA